MAPRSKSPMGCYWNESSNRWAGWYRTGDNKVRYAYGQRGDHSEEARAAVEAELIRRWRAADMAMTQARVSMDELLDFYLNQVTRSLKATTASNYAVLVGKIEPVLGAKYSDKVTHADVAALLGAIDSPNTRNRVLMVLRAVFKLAVGTGKA